MNDVIISARDLRKVYRLYAKPSYRFLDMFGLLGVRAGSYTEHAALDGINLEIRRGEKVAFIGRNGAGKSTLLKLVTGAIEPTSGTLDVKGRIHALLQIGTGFHPEFTGRENVYAYLAQLGVTGADADRRCAEAIEFAELEEYIDQPVKTYSTGMGVRLMFAASTVISPELLVLDEVLGVGDAYFAQKSFDRMQELCARLGTTLLLVTHDVYSAARMCDRIVWIDRGRLLMDGEAALVVKAYEDSIRQQEERRLRLKKQAQLKAAHAADAAARYVTVEVRVRENRPAAAPVYFADVSLATNRGVSALPLEADPVSHSPSAHLISDGTCWGASGEWLGRPARPMLNFGSPFHKVAGVVQTPGPMDRAALVASTVRLTLATEIASPLVVRCFLDDQEIDFGEFTPSAENWETIELTAAIDRQQPNATAEINTSGVHGTGTFAIDDVDVLDETGAPSLILRHGQSASFVIDYTIADPEFRGHVQVIIALYRDGMQTACRFGTNGLAFDATLRAKGRIELAVPSLNLGIGTYTLGVMIAEAGYLDREQTTFYTINPSVYASLMGVMEFNVIGRGLMPTNTAWVGDGRWSVSERREGL